MCSLCVCFLNNSTNNDFIYHKNKNNKYHYFRAIADEMKQFGISYEAYYGGDYKSTEFLENPLFLGIIEPDSALEVFQGVRISCFPLSHEVIVCCSILSPQSHIWY